VQPTHIASPPFWAVALLIVSVCHYIFTLSSAFLKARLALASRFLVKNFSPALCAA
jgi:hypothetical protein